MVKKQVCALAKDTYWLQAVTEAADESTSIEPVYCHRGYPECLEDMPAADQESLLLVDATGQRDVVGIVQQLRVQGWRYVVVVAADPSWKEAHAVLKIAGGHDYWEKSYVPDSIRRRIKTWQEELGASGPPIAAADPVPSHPMVAARQAEPDLNRPRILLADNDEVYRQSLRCLLESTYIVEEAGSVVQAQEKLEARPLDLALVDLRLTDDEDDRDTSGLAVARQAVDKQIPCIVITAFPSVEATRIALRQQGTDPPGAVDLIPKQHGPQAVLEALRQIPSLERFVLLHMSDLHFREPDMDLPYDQGRSLRSLLEDVRDLRAKTKLGRIRAIVASGDIAYRGQDQGFSPAREFLDEMCAEFRLSPKQVVLVPGNHDVDRSRARQEWDRLPDKQRETALLFSKFGAYLDFTTHFYGEPAFTQDRLYRVFDFGRLVIVALNSCYREGNPLYRCQICPEEHYHGWVGAQQISQALADVQRWLTGRSALRLAVCHHHALPVDQPARCLGDHLWDYADHLAYHLAEYNFSLLLHGHGHATQLWQPDTPGTGLPRLFGSGTLLLPTSKKLWENQYLIFDLAPTGSRVFMRQYRHSGRYGPGHWGPDSRIRADGIVKLEGINLPAVH